MCTRKSGKGKDVLVETWIGIPQTFVTMARTLMAKS